jgi:phenylpropionate dioxygenase-like ring-hydroxylating dioxygenase large terminal subunit
MDARIAAMVQETPDRFRVDPRIYDDPSVFDVEMQRIFGTCWIYVAHESEVAESGSYLTATIGATPVIVSRGRDGGLRVFLNACRHRGNVLCRDGGGIAATFTCRYHGWVYGNDGRVVTIPGVEAYPERFRAQRDELALAQARVATYRGLIFANLSDDGDSLESYLGAISPFIDLWAEQSPVGSARVAEPHAYRYPGNWKFQVENAVDMYHPPFVHQSAFNTFRQLGLARYQPDQRKPNMQASKTYGVDRGHSVLERPGLESVYSAEQFERYRGALVGSYGAERAKAIATIRHIQIFPNVCLMDGNIRVTQPVAIDRSHVYSYFVRLDGVDDDVNAARLDDYQRRIGTTGLVGTDDVDIFAGNQTGIRALGKRQLILERGIDREVLRADGVREGGPTDETPQRAIYRGWRRAMTGSLVSP